MGERGLPPTEIDREQRRGDIGRLRLDLAFVFRLGLHRIQVRDCFRPSCVGNRRADIWIIRRR